MARLVRLVADRFVTYYDTANHLDRSHLAVAVSPPRAALPLTVSIWRSSRHLLARPFLLHRRNARMIDTTIDIVIIRAHYGLPALAIRPHHDAHSAIEQTISTHAHTRHPIEPDSSPGHDPTILDGDDYASRSIPICGCHHCPTCQPINHSAVSVHTLEPTTPETTTHIRN